MAPGHWLSIVALIGGAAAGWGAARGWHHGGFDLLQRGLDWLDEMLEDPDVKAARDARRHPAATSTTRPTVWLVDDDGHRRAIER